MKKKDREEIDSAIAGFFVSSRNRYAAAWPSNNTTIYMDLEEVFSVSLRIRYLEFYLPLYSMDLLTPPSLSFCPLFSLTPYSFLLSFPRTGRALRRPLTRTTRIALPGISEVLSRIQRLHRPSWMDRQSSLTLRLSAPPLSLSLPPYTYPLARLLSLLFLSLSAAAVVVVSSPARSFSSESIQPLDARLYTVAGYSRKIHEFRCPVIREFRIFRISSPSPLVSSFFWQDTTHGVMVVKHLDDVSKSKSFRFLARFIRDRCILRTFNSGRIVKIRDIFSKRYSKQMFFQRVLSGERRYISCALREREEIRKTRFDLRC